MKKNYFIVNLLIFCVMIIVSIWAYFHLPERVATHWNAAGEIDGYSNRFIGAFLMPVITVAIYALFLILPKIDPKKENVAKFIGMYRGFVSIFLLYMLYIHVLTIAINLGFKFDMIKAMLPAFAGLFYYLGYIMPQAKPNWFLGIRTAWTLSSDAVWYKTHILGGKLFKISAILVLLGLFFSKYAIFFTLVPIIICSIYLTVYSYLEFNKEKSAQK